LIAYFQDSLIHITIVNIQKSIVRSSQNLIPIVRKGNGKNTESSGVRRQRECFVLIIITVNIANMNCRMRNRNYELVDESLIVTIPSVDSTYMSAVRTIDVMVCMYVCTRPVFYALFNGAHFFL
jgi:hypothetical protein